MRSLPVEPRLTSARHFTPECRAPAYAAETSIERLVLNAPVGDRGRSRQHHLALRIEKFQLGPGAHLVVAVERQLTADLRVLEPATSRVRPLCHAMCDSGDRRVPTRLDTPIASSSFYRDWEQFASAWPCRRPRVRRPLFLSVRPRNSVWLNPLESPKEERAGVGSPADPAPLNRSGMRCFWLADPSAFRSASTWEGGTGERCARSGPHELT